MSIHFNLTLKPIPEEPSATPSNPPISAKRRAELDKEVAQMFKDHQQFWKDNQENQKKMSKLGKK